MNGLDDTSALSVQVGDGSFAPSATNCNFKTMKTRKGDVSALRLLWDTQATRVLVFLIARN